MSDVLVIGGGIVGASAAYRLARAGVSVTLVDQSHEGQATAAGAGIIAPGTVLKAPPAFFPLSAASVAHYPELLAHLAEDGEEETGYETVGALFVATTDKEAERLPEVARIAEERQAAGVQAIGAVRIVGGSEAREMFPPLADVPAAIHQAEAARVNGRLLREALRRAAQRRGAAIIHGTAHLLRDGDRVTAVDIEGQRVHAVAIILAAGAWSASLGEELGVSFPVYPQRGQIMHLEMPDTDTVSWPIVLGFHSHYLLTFPAHRVVAGATREDNAGFDYRVTAGGVHEVLSEAVRIAPGLASATFHEMRVGFRPATPNRLPVMGRVPGLDNVYLATGHGASGLQLGPYSGAAVADLVLGKEPTMDLSPYTVSN